MLCRFLHAPTRKWLELEAKMWWHRIERSMKYCSIIGAHFVMMPVSFVWVYEDLSVYTDSYFRFACSPKCMDADSEWILSICIAMVCPGILIARKIAEKVGLKLAGILAAIISNAVTLAFAWTVKISVAGTIVLLGVIMGLMQGVTCVVVLRYVLGWAPDKVPLFVGTTSSFTTLASLVHKEIIRAIVNPEHFQPDALMDSRTLFSQQKVLERVPKAIIVYAAITGCFQFVGFLLLAPQPKPPEVSSGERENSNSSSEDGSVDLDDKSSRKPLKNPHTPGQRYGHEGYGSNGVIKWTLSQTADKPIDASSTLSLTKEKCTTPIEKDNQQKSVKPSEALKTPVFYVVSMFGMVTMFGISLKIHYYKHTELVYLNHKHYLTLVGILNPLVASATRVLLGWALTKHYIKVKDAIVFTLAVNSVLSACWYVMQLTNTGLYMFLVLTLALIQNLLNMILLLTTLHVFGPACLSINFGLVLLSCTLVGVLSPLVIASLTNLIGWIWLFGSASILSLSVLVLAVITDFSPQSSSP
ncbi:oxalate:formate antiporter [Elysia marginata]|uniref:Oxalate:formate antiporter n=1 Tax=Elysia marginata TaxID=1093978 RepID=A0AAV4JMT6_9GAST|nr:oxalate:formate antiporter [Elysia marginata]